MIMDQYKEQYRKETEQIHAPAELIARTKAAMREEEARIRREFRAAGSGNGKPGDISSCRSGDGSCRWQELWEGL